MHAIAIVMLTLIIGAGLGAFVGYKIKEEHTRPLVDSNNWFREKWLTKCGWIGYRSYRLESLDGGKNWYAAKWTADGQLRILGAAEEKFPGVLKRLRALDRLEDYQRRNGPLTLSGPNAALERVLLEDAGISAPRKNCHAG